MTDPPKWFSLLYKVFLLHLRLGTLAPRHGSGQVLPGSTCPGHQIIRWWNPVRVSLREKIRYSCQPDAPSVITRLPTLAHIHFMYLAFVNSWFIYAYIISSLNTYLLYNHTYHISSMSHYLFIKHEDIFIFGHLYTNNWDSKVN